MDHPYREVPPPEPVALVRRLPVRRGQLVASSLAAVVAAGGMVAVGASFEMVAGIGLAIGAQVYALLSLRGRKRVVKVFDALPFSVRHDPASAMTIDRATSPPTLRDVRVILASVPDDRDAERIGREIVALVPNLVAAVDGDTFFLERWPWGDDHVTKLAEVLGTWGRKVHEHNPIREVVVRWSDS